MIRTIALNRLRASPRNVRSSSDDQADRELKADLEARGLLQNLVVSPLRKPKGHFAVEAGGRRLRALQALVAEDKLPADHEVACLVIDGDLNARETSLAENFQRLAMNPADECLAFRQLVDSGLDIDGIARRFGLTARFVEGRLRLAGLAQVVFEALGAGDIGLEQAKAYAVTPDPERQAWVFEQVSRSGYAVHPDSIRRMMTQETASGLDRRARFVGEEAYVAAGGRIERDLFSDEATARWLDVPLLERLASEKLEQAAADHAAATGLAWIRPCVGGWVSGADLEGLRRLSVEQPPLSEEEAKRLASLERDLEGLETFLESGDGDEAARAEALDKAAQLESQIEAIASRPPVLDADAKATAGTFLLIGEDGVPRLDGSFYTDAAMPSSVPQGQADEECPSETAGAARPALSQRLADELAMQRRDVLALHVAREPEVALDLATFLMVDREAGWTGERTGSSLRADPPSNPVVGLELPDDPVRRAREQVDAALDRSWTEGADLAARFDLFRRLAPEARSAWLAHGVARTLEASLGVAGTHCIPFHDHLGQLLGIEPARWWRPTCANYFDRVSKATALAALEEVGGPSLALSHARAKKADLAQACERLFAGRFEGDEAVAAAACAWVPEPMRFAQLASDPEPGASGGEEGGDGDVPDEAVAEAAAAAGAEEMAEAA